MGDSRPFRLRVRYGKTGRLVMLSHLEVAHALERTVRRARLPFAVTNGFSPHMRIAFGAALPVGVGGTDELFDIFLTTYVRPEEALSALQQASPHDLMPTSCAYEEPDAPAASVAFPRSSYRAQLAFPLEELLVPELIEVKRKKKEKVIKVSDHLCGPVKAEGCELIFDLEAKPTGSLRPDAFLRACLDETARICGGEVPAIEAIVRTSQN